MKAWRGWQLPDGEQHLIDWMTEVNDVRFGRPTYQAHKYDQAMRHVKRRRTVVDIGANLGMWSFLMAHDFKELQAFEPVAAYAECWVANVPKGLLHNVALGAAAGRVDMICSTGGSCGDTTVDAGQPGDRVAEGVAMITLDSCNLADVDLIKIDAEGYELFILRGARETIERCKPVVIVEQKKGHGATFGLDDTAAVDYLRGAGMTLEGVVSGDYILSFR